MDPTAKKHAEGTERRPSAAPIAVLAHASKLDATILL
jgi:hypothetical protein